MHPRNRYAKQKELDLVHLSKEYPPLLACLKQHSSKLQFDPRVPGAVDALVTALIRVDFGITSYKGVPKGSLVPSVTRSLNYIHFIEDLLSEAQSKGVNRDNLDKHCMDYDIKSNEDDTGKHSSVSSNKQVAESCFSREQLEQCANSPLVEKEPKEQVDANNSETSDTSSTPCFITDNISNQGNVLVTRSLKDDQELDATFISNANVITNSQNQKRMRRIGQQQELLLANDDRDEDEIAITNKIKGIDVGVGASCIFPILSCSMHENWHFVGIDVDEIALEWAKTNSLQFKDRIQLRMGPRGPIPQIKQVSKDETFDFVMCNPPFFSHPDETYSYRFDFNGKDEDDINDEILLHTERTFGGTDLERWCEGGEVGFVSGLIEESANQLRNNVIWFTSMLGMKSSLNPILAKLHEINPQTIRVHRLEQGHRARWVVAWSFQESLAILPIRGRIIPRVDNLEPGESLQQRIRSALEELRGFTIETGICGGSEGFRFRIQVIELDGGVRVDALDLKRGKNETDDDVRRRAVSTVRKVEQGIERKSRRWKKRKRGKIE